MKVLLINNTPTHCGVQQYGLNTYKILSGSKNMEVVYAECGVWNEVKNQILSHSPNIVLYNYHPATMPWLMNNARKINSNSRYPGGARRLVDAGPGQIEIDIGHMGADVRHIGIIHEPNLPKPSIFNSLIQQADMPRILFDCEDKYMDSGIPVIGSFGFGAWHKGFHHLVSRVQSEYDNALIRFHMPHAHYINTSVSVAVTKKCKELVTKPGIKLEIDHDFFTQEQLVAWLNQNTINVFHYDRMEGAGNSSSLDQALSAKRPIGITKSYMFRHIVTNPSIFIEDLSIKQIISNGISPLLPYYEKWSNENFIKAYEEVLLSA